MVSTVVLLFSSLSIGVPDPSSLMGLKVTTPHAQAAQTQKAPAAQELLKPPAELTAYFLKRVDEYLALRKVVTSKLPEVKETGDPAKISTREKALGEAIAKARSSAKAGDVFGPGMSTYFAKILAADWKSRSSADRKALFEEVPADLQLKVNQAYPTTIPLITVPAMLLAQLPMLPEELEYRLVDRRLLMRDRDANLIVDVILGVAPQDGR
jgi:hypothetical protein